MLMETVSTKKEKKIRINYQLIVKNLPFFFISQCSCRDLYLQWALFRQADQIDQQNQQRIEGAAVRIQDHEE